MCPSFLPLEVLDCRSPSARKKISELRREGVPVVIVGWQDFTKFADAWVFKDGWVINSTSVATSTSHTPPCKRTLDTDSMVQALGNEVVTIAACDADDIGTEKSHHTMTRMKLRKFVHSFWLQGDNTTYLHQWQFTSNSFALQLLQSMGLGQVLLYYEAVCY